MIPVDYLVKGNNLGEKLNAALENLGTVFPGLFYKDLTVSRDITGTTISYSLVLISQNELAVNIPGTGIRIILNPATSGSFGSEFPINIAFSVGILKYVSSFKIGSFSFSPEDFFELSKKLVPHSGEDLVLFAIETFVNDPDPVGRFASDANSRAGTTIPTPVNPDQDIALSEVTEHIITSDQKSPWEVVFTTYIDDADLEVLKQNADNYLFRLFTGFPRMGDGLENISTFDKIKQLFYPRISASMQVELRVELPVETFTPIDALGNPVPGQPFALDFNAGEVFYNFPGSIGFDTNLAATTNFPRCAIGESGITFSLTYARLSLSQEEQIASVESDFGLKFAGLYIEEASIGLPPRLLLDGPVQANLVGRKIFVGTGGFSGIIGIEENNGVGLLKTRIGGQNGIELSLDSFSLTFQQNSIIGSDVRGSIIIPGFKDGNNAAQDALIDVLVHFGQNSFGVTATLDTPLKVQIPNVLELYIKSLSLGEFRDRYYLSVSGQIKITANPAGISGGLIPDAIDVNEFKIWDDGEIEFSGGGISLPKAVSLSVGPAKINISRLGFGTTKMDRGTGERSYRYFSFDGGLAVNPGGVEVRGNGIQYFFTKSDGQAFDHFLRIASIHHASVSALLGKYLLPINPRNP